MLFQKRHFADYSFDTSQGDLFIDSSSDVNENPLSEMIADIDAFNPDTSTPLEALMFVTALKRKLKEREEK